MKVNKNSWHYKLIDRNSIWATKPQTLCQYFWAVVWHLIMKVLIGLKYIGVGLIVVWMIHGVYLVFTQGISKEPSFIQAVLEFGGIIPLVVLIAAMATSVIFVSINLVKKLHQITINKKSVDKQPNIVVEYVKAKKNKICPMINYED